MNRPEEESDTDKPYSVWSWDRSVDQARVYHTLDPEAAVERCARADYREGNDGKNAWPRSYCVRNDLTEETSFFDVSLVTEPRFVVSRMPKIEPPPLVHVLWNGLACCSLQGKPSEWPPGHRWIPLADVIGGKKPPVECCKKCWAKAPFLIKHLQRIGQK